MSSTMAQMRTTRELSPADWEWRIREIQGALRRILASTKEVPEMFRKEWVPYLATPIEASRAGYLSSLTQLEGPMEHPDYESLHFGFKALMKVQLEDVREAIQRRVAQEDAEYEAQFARASGNNEEVLNVIDKLTRAVKQTELGQAATLRAIANDREKFVKDLKKDFARAIKGETSMGFIPAERAMFLNLLLMPEDVRLVFFSRVMKCVPNLIAEYNFLVRREMDDEWKTLYSRTLVEATMPLLSDEAGAYANPHTLADAHARSSELSGGGAVADRRDVFATTAKPPLVGGDILIPVITNQSGASYVNLQPVADVTVGLGSKIQQLEQQFSAIKQQINGAGGRSASPPSAVRKAPRRCFNCGNDGHMGVACPLPLTDAYKASRFYLSNPAAHVSK